MTATAARPGTAPAGQPPDVAKPRHKLAELTTYDSAITAVSLSGPSRSLTGRIRCLRYVVTCKPGLMTCWPR